MIHALPLVRVEYEPPDVPSGAFMSRLKRVLGSGLRSVPWAMHLVDAPPQRVMFWDGKSASCHVASPSRCASGEISAPKRRPWPTAPMTEAMC
jgi:hypothetical protein